MNIARNRNRPRRTPPGLFYQGGFLSPTDRAEVVRWLSELHPIWERRYSLHHPAPEGKEERALLRPVYWLGNWQFACLGYYHPPQGTRFRCVSAEPFPPVLRSMVNRIEKQVKQRFPPSFIPQGWHLNTCLVNLYGTRIVGDRRTDTARVGEHKDFEPGPVASVSLGERALFQFVSSRGKGHQSQVILQQWLEDGSLQIFGGDDWKRRYFHRVQRVDKKGGHFFPMKVEGFETRRVNFTFRYVPAKDIVPLKQFPKTDIEDVTEYVKKLGENSEFWSRA